LAIAYALAKYSFLPQAPRRSLVFKFVFIVLVLLIFLFGPVSIWFYKKISFEARESVRREAMIIARVASKLIDVEKHEKILSPEDEGTPLYNEVRAKIKELALEDPRIDGIYTLRKTEKENILAFVLDTYDTQDLNGDGIIEPDEERAHVGEEYDISEMSEFQKGFYEVSADYEPICDKWGCWLSGYAPIKDKTGKTVAVLGVDFSAETVKKMEGTFKKGVLAFLFLVLVPIIIALYIVVRLFIRPIKQLEKDFLTFAEDPSHRSKIKTGDEFETLALSFNKMAERIAGIRGELEKGIRERTKELQIKTEEAERLSRLAVGRELKMIDLKKKIKELEEKLKEKLK
jgi:methyl-accepting chemotaxis protein